MAKASVQISGRNGVVALVLVIGFAMFRFLSLTASNDIGLKQKILVELQSDVGNEVGKLIQKDSGSSDYTELAENVSRLAQEAPTIHGLWVSESLLKLSSSAKAVVKVEFSLPMSSKRTIKYYKAKDSVIGGWTIQGETTVVAYYLNFL